MAIGMSSSGGETPCANFTSNAHEHVVDIKQDLPKKETQKLNIFSPTIYKINHFKLIPSFRSSLWASGSGAAVTSAPKMNGISLLPLTSRRHISLTRSLSSPLTIPPPWPLSNNQNSPIPSFQDLQDAVVLITNNQKLPYSVRIFSIASDQLQDVVGGLEQSIKDVLEGWTSTNCMYTLAASIALLEEVVNKAKAVHQNQSDMQKKQQSDGESLDAELRGIGLLKDIYSTIFTSSAAFLGAGAFFAARIHPLSVAMTVGVFAAGASVVSIAVGKRLDSYQDKLKIPVEKRKEITAAISGASMLALEDLRYIEELASTLKSDAESMLEMVDSGATESDAIVTEMETLKQRFQQLETRIDRCSKNAVSRKQALVDNILNKLD